MRTVDGEKLRDMRRKSGKTLKQISALAGITESQILQIETGVTRNPRIGSLLGLAHALGCEISALLA